MCSPSFSRYLLFSPCLVKLPFYLISFHCSSLFLPFIVSLSSSLSVSLSFSLCPYLFLCVPISWFLSLSLSLSLLVMLSLSLSLSLLVMLSFSLPLSLSLFLSQSFSLSWQLYLSVYLSFLCTHVSLSLFLCILLSFQYQRIFCSNFSVSDRLGISHSLLLSVRSALSFFQCVSIIFAANKTLVSFISLYMNKKLINIV